MLAFSVSGLAEPQSAQAERTSTFPEKCGGKILEFVKSRQGENVVGLSSNNLGAKTNNGVKPQVPEMTSIVAVDNVMLVKIITWNLYRKKRIFWKCNIMSLMM